MRLVNFLLWKKLETFAWIWQGFHRHSVDTKPFISSVRYVWWYPHNLISRDYFRITEVEYKRKCALQLLKSRDKTYLNYNKIIYIMYFYDFLSVFIKKQKEKRKKYWYKSLTFMVSNRQYKWTAISKQCKWNVNIDHHRHVHFSSADNYNYDCEISTTFTFLHQQLKII